MADDTTEQSKRPVVQEPAPDVQLSNQTEGKTGEGTTQETPPNEAEEQAKEKKRLETVQKLQEAYRANNSPEALRKLAMQDIVDVKDQAMQQLARKSMVAEVYDKAYAEALLGKQNPTPEDLMNANYQAGVAVLEKNRALQDEFAKAYNDATDKEKFLADQAENPLAQDWLASQALLKIQEQNKGLEQQAKLSTIPDFKAMDPADKDQWAREQGYNSFAAFESAIKAAGYTSAEQAANDLKQVKDTVSDLESKLAQVSKGDLSAASIGDLLKAGIAKIGETLKVGNDVAAEKKMQFLLYGTALLFPNLVTWLVLIFMLFKMAGKKAAHATTGDGHGETPPVTPTPPTSEPPAPEPPATPEPEKGRTPLAPPPVPAGSETTEKTNTTTDKEEKERKKEDSGEEQPKEERKEKEPVPSEAPVAPLPENEVTTEEEQPANQPDITVPAPDVEEQPTVQRPVVNQPTQSASTASSQTGGTSSGGSQSSPAA